MSYYQMSLRFPRIYIVDIDKGLRIEEDEWIDNLRGYWDRVNFEKCDVYVFSEEFDAIMCKMWFK